jgi:hypothetical protein
LLTQIGRRRQELQQEAIILGRRIYGERPRGLSRRLHTCWRAWQEEGILATAGPVRPSPAALPVKDSPELVADTRCRTGEGPLWHGGESRLYWVDIPAGKLYRYDPQDGSYEQVFEAEGAIGGFTVQADDSLLLFLAAGGIAVWRQGEGLQYLVEGIDVDRESRFNDVIADPTGRVYCGTMASADAGGRLYRLDTDGSLTESGVPMAWDSHRTTTLSTTSIRRQSRSRVSTGTNQRANCGIDRSFSTPVMRRVCRMA